MSAFKGWLQRLRAGEGQGQFADWPLPPAFRPVAYPRLSELPQLDGAPAFRPDPTKYEPALVIALGPAGEEALRQWLQQLAQDEAGPQERLGAILITTRPTEALPTDRMAVRQLDLSAGALRTAAAPSPGRNRRGETQALARDAQNSLHLREYLRIFLAELERDIRIILIGSLVEPEIGMLGDVLQMLHLLAPERAGGPYLGITALLALESLEAPLENGEIYAALRELGRFTFNGWHWMERPAGMVQGIVRGALLDHLFLLETAAMPGAQAQAGPASFRHATGQALAEALFTLLHPASGVIWEHLVNDAARNRETQATTHEAIVGAIGIATLQIPLLQTQRYVASRLAYAAMFGERPQPAAEGIITRQKQELAAPASAAWLAHRWLTEGATAHPLFSWLLAVDGPTHLRSAPLLTPEFELLFQVQLARGLVSFLNDSAETNQLTQAQVALSWLKERLSSVNDWFQQAQAPNPGAAERLSFQYLLNRWQETTLSLLQQIEQWQAALLASGRGGGASPTSGWRDSHTATNPAQWRQNLGATDWRSQAPSGATAAVPAEATGPAATGSLLEVLQEQRRRAERALQEAAGGAARRALTADEREGLSEVDSYYGDTVRPELTRHGYNESTAFRRVRERLGWWMHLQPGRQPQLLFICLPPQFAGLGTAGVEPPQEARFAPTEVSRLGEALLALGMIQAQRLAADLTGAWFSRRLDRLHAFLSRAGQPLLEYDRNAAARRRYRPSHHIYLIGRDQSITGAYRERIFPNVAAQEINELDGNDPIRLTALSLWIGIPLDSLQLARQTYGAYHHQEQLHLYPQERTATRYERRIRSLTGHWQLLAPSFILALADDQLVTLFCQALLCGLIEVQYDEFHLKPRWTLSSVNEGFTTLPLASAEDVMGLWHSLRLFALELPNSPDLLVNPTQPFHPARRGAFLAALRQQTQRCRLSPSFLEQRRTVETGFLAEMARRGQQNTLAKALSGVLAVELEEPLWRGWRD